MSVLEERRLLKYPIILKSSWYHNIFLVHSMLNIIFQQNNKNKQYGRVQSTEYSYQGPDRSTSTIETILLNSTYLYYQGHYINSRHSIVLLCLSCFDFFFFEGETSPSLKIICKYHCGSKLNQPCSIRRTPSMTALNETRLFEQRRHRHFGDKFDGDRYCTVDKV